MLTVADNNRSVGIRISHGAQIKRLVQWYLVVLKGIADSALISTSLASQCIKYVSMLHRTSPDLTNDLTSVRNSNDYHAGQVLTI